MEQSTLEAIVVGGGAVVFTTGLTQIVKRLLVAGKIAPVWIDAIVPLIALVLGVIIVLVASFGLDMLTRADIVGGIFAGIAAGLAAIGLWTVTQTPARIVEAEAKT